MYRFLQRGGWDATLLMVEIVGFVLAVLTFVGALHVLFLTQVLTSGAFAVLLVRSALKLDTRSPVTGIT
jgi:hypothetical protein